MHKQDQWQYPQRKHNCCICEEVIYFVYHFVCLFICLLCNKCYKKLGSLKSEVAKKSKNWVRLNYATTHHYPPPSTTSQNIYTTTHKMNHHSAKAKIYPYITSFWNCFNRFFYFENTIVLYVTEILYDKVSITSFFRLKISFTFYDI